MRSSLPPYACRARRAWRPARRRQVGHQAIPVDERSPRRARGGDGGIEVGDVVLLPNDIAGLHVERQQVAHRAEDVDDLAVHRWRGPRADRVNELQAAVVGLPLAGPEHLPGLLVDGQGPLDRLVRLDPARVDDEDPAAGDGRTGVARIDWSPARSPSGPRRAACRRFPSRAIRQAAAPPPFRPVVCAERRASERDDPAGAGEKDAPKPPSVKTHRRPFR